MSEVHVDSYFSLETDIAGELRHWPEFRSGQGYNAELASSDGAETVSVSLARSIDDDRPYVRVAANNPGALFDRVLGRVTYALAAHSDYLMVHRIT